MTPFLEFDSWEPLIYRQSVRSIGSNLDLWLAPWIGRDRSISILSLLPSPQIDVLRSHQCALCPWASSRIKLIGLQGGEWSQHVYFSGSLPVSSLQTSCVPWQKVTIPLKAAPCDSLLTGSGNLSFPCLFGPRNGDISAAIARGSCTSPNCSPIPYLWN